MRHLQLVTYTVTSPLDITTLYVLSTYFPYSHSGGKFKHNVTNTPVVRQRQRNETTAIVMQQILNKQKLN